MVAYLRFDDLKVHYKTVDKLTHVFVRIQDIKNYDGEPYNIFHVDCLNPDGKAESYDNVLDVMIE